MEPGPGGCTTEPRLSDTPDPELLPPVCTALCRHLRCASQCWPPSAQSHPLLLPADEAKVCVGSGALLAPRPRCSPGTIPCLLFPSFWASTQPISSLMFWAPSRAWRGACSEYTGGDLGRKDNRPGVALPESFVSTWSRVQPTEGRWSRDPQVSLRPPLLRGQLCGTVREPRRGGWGCAVHTEDI